MIKKIFLFVLLFALLSINLQGQEIILGQNISNTEEFKAYKFNLKNNEFHTINLNLSLQQNSNSRIDDGAFISLQMEEPSTKKNIEFARVYLQSNYGKQTTEEIIYEFDLQLWQKWLLTTPHILLYSNANIENLDISLFLSAEVGKANIDVLDIIPLWQSDLSGFPYTEEGVSEKYLNEIIIKLPEGTHHAIASVLVSGQSDDLKNTAARFYFLELNDKDVSKRSIWRDDCSINPLDPQQEDWYLSRPNWCPGLKVHPIHHFIAKEYINGKQLKLDLSFQEDQGKTSGIDSYVTSSVLFALSEPKEAINLSIKEIFSPNNKIWHRSYNPICSSPVILIQNLGSEPVNSITFNYGYNYEADNKFRWKGELSYLEEEIIYLPSLNWYFFEDDDKPESFTVHIASVNGKEKAFEDGKKTSKMTLADVYPPHLVFEIITDHNAHLNGLEIFNDMGENYFTSGELKADTSYQFEVDFLPGCYEMIFYDEAGDGVQISNAQEDFFIIKNAEKNSKLKSFDGNFGSEVREQFMIFK